MNKLFLVLVAITACLSCTSKGEYAIKGTAPKDFDGKKVYLSNQRGDGVESVDSVEIKGGKFFFKGIQEKPAIYVISLGDLKNSSNLALQAVLLVEPGNLTVDMVGDKMRIGGTPVNEAFQKKVDSEGLLYTQEDALNQKYASVDPATLSEDEIEKINDEFMSIEDSVKDLNLNFVKANINNPLGEGIFFSLASRLSLEELEMIINNAGDEFKSGETGKAVLGMIDGMKKVAEGQKFTDFTMPDPSGKKISLSDFAGKGKYVLIDFWASWCGPCIKEMPNLVDVYKLYKNKNFEIVGVSLDSKAEPWKAAIQKSNMTWPQMSDLQQWQSQAREIYNFNAIPHTILLDPDGIIIAKDLRGKKLLEKLQELIK